MGLFSRVFGRRRARVAAPTSISPAHLPPELHYIIPLADLHGSEVRVHGFDHRLGRHVSYGEKLSADAIKPLRNLYIEIREKGHGELINRWHDDAIAQANVSSRDYISGLRVVVLIRPIG